MVDPGGAPDRPRPSHAIFHASLDGVAAGLQKGLSLWIQESGSDAVLIPAKKLRVVYAGNKVTTASSAETLSSRPRADP
jgi:hypothetical protein